MWELGQESHLPELKGDTDCSGLILSSCNISSILYPERRVWNMKCLISSFIKLIRVSSSPTKFRLLSKHPRLAWSTSFMLLSCPLTSCFTHTHCPTAFLLWPPLPGTSFGPFVSWAFLFFFFLIKRVCSDSPSRSFPLTFQLVNRPSLFPRHGTHFCDKSHSFVLKLNLWCSIKN